MRKLRIISIIAVVAMLMSVISLPTVSAAGIEELVYEAFEKHRGTSNDAQEAEIKNIEAVNATLVAKGYNEAPWSTILTGAKGLLTSEIKEKLSSKRTLTLEFLRGKNITLATPNAEIESAIAAFKSENDEILTRYDLDDVSIKDSAARYNKLEDELTEIFKDYNKIYKKVTETSNTLLVDGAAFSGIDSVPVEKMFSEKITKVFKDANSLLFAGKDTWQAKYKELLCGENKITMGLIIGREGAAALANAENMQRVYDYIDSADILKTVVKYQTDLYSDDLNGKSNPAFYALLKDVFDDILALQGMEDVKTALDNIGWTTENIVSAMKITQDAADKDFHSRAINLNMILGRYLDVYQNGLKQAPVKVFVNTAKTDEYDICVAKGVYRASVINVIDTKAINKPGCAISTSDDDGRLRFTVAASDIGTGYDLECYRDGSDKASVQYYIATKKFDVADGKIPVQSITIKEGSSIEIYIGESTQLGVIISPVNATNQNVTWTIDDSEIADVDDAGVLTGIKVGNATVTVTTEDGGYTATITVTVKKRSGGMGGLGGGGGTQPTATPTPTVQPTPTTPPTGSHYFADLENHWAADELDELIEKGVVEGYGEDGSTGGLEGVEAIYKFYPDRPISRAEFATIICRMMSLPVTKEGVIYKDTENHWARDYVATATKYGYMIGVSEDMFAPDWPIPREQVIAVIMRVLTFGYDVLNPGTHKIYTSDEILELVKAHFNYEYTDLSQQVTDINSGSGWARAYVEMAYKGSFVEGYEDHTMRPLLNATRAEAIVIAKRALWK